MPSYRNHTASYRLHKSTRQAVVTLGGRDYYLGRHSSPESRAEYDRLIVEWISNGRPRAQPAAVSDSTINELLLAYLRYADGYYVKNGKPTVEPGNIRLASRPLRALYGHTPAREFGPVALKAVRQAMIDSGLCRSEINRRVGRIVRAIKWAVSEELVPASVHHALQTVVGLRQGRTVVREDEPVKPVPEAFVEAIEPYVSRQDWAMVQLQLLTGMRPGEVCIMRTAALDTMADLKRSIGASLCDFQTVRGRIRTLVAGCDDQGPVQSATAGVGIRRPGRIGGGRRPAASASLPGPHRPASPARGRPTGSSHST